MVIIGVMAAIWWSCSPCREGPRWGRPSPRLARRPCPCRSAGSHPLHPAKVIVDTSSVRMTTTYLPDCVSYTIPGVWSCSSPRLRAHWWQRKESKSSGRTNTSVRALAPISDLKRNTILFPLGIAINQFVLQPISNFWHAHWSSCWIMEKRAKALFSSIIFTIHTIKVKTRLPLQYKYQDYQTWVLKKTEFLFHNHFTHPHQKYQTLHGLLESWKRQSSYFYDSFSRTHTLVSWNLGCRSLGTVWTCRLCGTIPPRGNPHRGCCSPSTMMMMSRMTRVWGDMITTIIW